MDRDENEGPATGGAEPGGDSTPPADDRDADLQVLGQVDDDLDGLDGALERLDAGGYDLCEVCGRPIGEDRLRARPLTRTCAEHAPPSSV
jgi:RNA polymerase-binding transcription factor DksA